MLADLKVAKDGDEWYAIVFLDYKKSGYIVKKFW